MKPLQALLTSLVLAIVTPIDGERSRGCSVEPHYSFYNVEGDSIEQIHESLLSNGPRDERGQARFAYTDWTIEWDWKKRNDTRIKADSLQLRCSATIRLPRLRAKSGMRIELIRSWNDFVERTRDHELRHLEHVVSGATRIRSRLKSAETRPGGLSANTANKIIQRVVQEIRHFDREYDLRTNHGRTEGTWTVEGVDV